MEAARQLNQPDPPAAPSFSGTLAEDAKTAADFLSAAPDAPDAAGHPSVRSNKSICAHDAPRSNLGMPPICRGKKRHAPRSRLAAISGLVALARPPPP
jgi:hypothetical protein